MLFVFLVKFPWIDIGIDTQCERAKGVQLLVQKREHQRKSHIAVGNAEHEDIDVLHSELPVSAVDDRFETCFVGLQTEYQAGNQVAAKVKAGNEAL